jgi:hypothetical protein
MPAAKLDFKVDLAPAMPRAYLARESEVWFLSWLDRRSNPDLPWTNSAGTLRPDPVGTATQDLRESDRIRHH